jgi:hypothetical protein
LTDLRSPLKVRPLRVAGQSLDDEIQRLVVDDGVPFAMLAVFAVVLAALAWLQAVLETPFSPWAATLVAALLFAYSLYRLVRFRRRFQSLRLGRDGERLVAESLDELRADGAVVFHDITAPGFNIDHVVVSHQGLFAIETKTLAKPPQAEAAYDGHTLVLGGRTVPRNPVTQVEACADWVQDTLEAMTGKRYPVRPVVVLPGWFVRLGGDAQRFRTWVLNPKMLAAFVKREPVRIAEEDVRLAVYCLARYVRMGRATRS